MTRLTLYTGDNLATLRALVAAGEKFDLVELDGPYAAGLEAGWDCLTEDEYLAHYAERLTLVRRLLQPWGVVFVFGYPEGCAEIKAWARQSGTLHLRRWINWLKNQTVHEGRKIEVILVFQAGTPRQRVLGDFGQMLKTKRLERGWSLRQVSERAAHLGHEQWWHRGGTFYFETNSHGDTKGGRPSARDLQTLSQLFDFDIAEWDWLLTDAYDKTTSRDLITVPLDREVKLNDNGLRSKPIGLYFDLFRPTMPPRETKRALICYGGSGNAGIAAGQLGYDVSICEQDERRCEAIRRRWAWKVEYRDETPQSDLGPLFNQEAA